MCHCLLDFFRNSESGAVKVDEIIDMRSAGYPECQSTYDDSKFAYKRQDKLSLVLIKL